MSDGAQGASGDAEKAMDAWREWENRREREETPLDEEDSGDEPAEKETSPSTTAAGRDQDDVEAVADEAPPEEETAAGQDPAEEAHEEGDDAGHGPQLQLYPSDEDDGEGVSDVAEPPAAPQGEGHRSSELADESPAEPDPVARSPRSADSARRAGGARPSESRATSRPSEDGDHAARGVSGTFTSLGPDEDLTGFEAELSELRDQAIRAARADADAGLPHPDAHGASQSEVQLRNWCRSLFSRWQVRVRQRFGERVAELEEAISEKLDGAALGMDRMERIINEIVRLRARLSTRKEQVTRELEEEKKASSGQGLTTRLYLAAITFLGLVEFFANAPVFSALLPRDPLTERQINLITQTSDGWLLGFERVMAQILLRPDAALLAAGVVTFLCVLAHFFGHSLRDLVNKRDRRMRREALSGPTSLENLVPMGMTAVGLILVLGVLYQARITLGEVGQRQYEQDMAQVEELRRESSWLRSDGDLLQANQITDQAEDLSQAAEDMREYSVAMSRMSFPILLLNMTLVLCAICAAYFHKTGSGRQRFDEQPFDEDRASLVSAAEDVADDVAATLADVARKIRRLEAQIRRKPLEEWPAVVHALEATLDLYRVENGRSRGIDPRTIRAFREPVEMDLNVQMDNGVPEPGQSPQEYRERRKELADRFEKLRSRFNDVVNSEA